MDYMEYRAEVEAIAKDIIDSWLRREGKASLRDEDVPDAIYDAVHEWVGDHHWIIYHTHNMGVLENSHNADAIDDLGVELDTSRGWRDILTQIAFWAMRTDVEEAVREEWDRLTEEYEEQSDEEA